MDREQAIMESTNFWDDPQVTGKPVDLLGFATVFIRRWPFLVLMAILGFVFAAGVSMLLTPEFTSRAVFLPPSQQAATSDSPLSFLLRPPSSNIYLGLLTSDSVLTDVIQHSDLEKKFKAKDIEQARAMLRRESAVSSDANGFVTVQVTDKDPHLAQQIASNYLGALARLNDRLAISEAEQHRVLFQSEFEKAKNDLEKSEVDLKQAQEASGVVSPDAQIRSGLSAIDSARADIRARQVALAAMLKGETDQSPDVQRLRSEISAEQAQLGSLESAASSGPGTGLTATQAPSVNLRFVQLEREVKYNQVLFDVMAKQYENARLQETSAAPGVQIVDFPELPLHKSKPSRALIALAGFVIGGLLGLILVFIRNRLQVLEQDPLRASSLHSFRRAFVKPSFRP
jgi:uncharacterized protein involved in exopolysaccharide biosynthesis